MGEQVWQERLADALTGVGHPALLLVEGTAGMGKSRLARRLAELRGAGARLVATFRPSGALAVSVPASAAVSGGRRRAYPGGREAGPEADTERAAARDLGAALASVRPDLLVVEDVHHAGEGALAVLRGLLADPPERFAAVLTYRPEQLPRRGLPLGRAVDYPARMPVTRWELRPLDERRVRDVAGELLGAERCSEEFVARLCRASAGVPQVVVDLLGLLRDVGAGRSQFTARDVEEAGVPVRLAESVLDRVGSLPEAHRGVVRAAAVLGEPSSARELSAVAGLPEAEGREALVAALEASALQEAGGGRYGFAVPLAASAVYGQVPGPLLERLHHRAAVALAAREPVPRARVARHLQRCGRTEEWLRATEDVADGGGGDGPVTDDETAVALLEQALGEDGGPPGRRARLAMALARGATLGLRTDETVRVLRGIVADSSVPAGTRGEIRLELGLLLHNQKRRFDEGREQVRRAVDELSGRPAPATAALAALANPFFPGSSLAENRRWLRKAEETAGASRDATARAAAAASRATLLTATGDPAAWELLDRLPRDGSAVAERQQAARALCNAASAAVHLGHHRRGGELLAEGRELAARSQAPFLERVGCGTALYRDWLTGSWEGLGERCTRAVAEDGTANEARTVRALLALAQGEWAAVRDGLPPGGPPAFEGCEVPVATAAAGVHIRLLLARDQTGPAASAAASAWEWLGAKGVWPWGAELAPWAVEALARADRRPEAGRLVDAFAEGLAGADAPAAAAALLRCRAVLAETDGEPATAAARFREAAAAYAALAYPYAQALASEGAGRCAFLAGGATDEAVGELTGCVEQLSRLGASWDAARARATLRECHPASGRRPRGRPAYGEGLSPREAEVAGLAGSGLTNREIAATLHLSPRTVEHHVARAMRKLGVVLRQDLAARVPDGAAGVDSPVGEGG